MNRRFINPPTYEFYKRRIGDLCEKFPRVFNKELPLPLKVGVHKELPAASGFTQKECNALLRVWVGRGEYQCMAASLGYRYELDGTIHSKIDIAQMSGFIANVVSLRPRTLFRFSERYKAAYGRPGLLFVPIKVRPELEINGGEEPQGSNC